MFLTMQNAGNEGIGAIGETYEQCVARRTKICDENLDSSIKFALAAAGLTLLIEGVIAIVAAGLSRGAATLPAAVITLLTVAGAAAYVGLQISKAYDERAGCIRDIPDLCRGLP